jgi:branched-chain amino acid transport system substrate-binding protein
MNSNFEPYAIAIAWLIIEREDIKVKKQILFCVIVLMVAMLLTACGTTPTQTEQPAPSETPETPEASETPETPETPENNEPIKIGVVSTFSGANSGHGEYCKEGVELWLEDVNDKGGILGRPVEVVYEDNGATDQEFMNAFIKLLSGQEVSAIYSNGFSNQAALISPEVEKYEIPYLAGCSSQSVLELGNDYFWMLRLSDRIVSPTMVNACVEILNMKNPAILHVSDSYGVGMADFVEKAFNEKGIEVATRISADVDEKQFSTYLAKIVDAGADGIVAIQHQEQAPLVMMQADSMGIDIPLMGCSQYASALSIDTAGDAANGWYSLSDWTVEVTTEEGKAFVERYRETYDRDPDMQSVVGYDAMVLIEDAINRAGSSDPKEINKALHDINDVKGVMTSYDTDGTDHCIGQSIFLVQTVDKKGKLIDIVNR